MGGPSRQSHGRHAVWSVETDPGSASVYPAELSALLSALLTGGRRALGVATRRIWLGGDCADWSVALSGTSQCAGDAPGTYRTWHQHCAAQRDVFDAAL